MNFQSRLKLLLYVFTSVIAVCLSPLASAATAIDAEAAMKLAKNAHCLRCHGLEKKKEGPSYAFLAARYEGKPGAEDKLVKHISSGNLVKLSDGHKENHKVIQNLNPDDLRNLVRWILAQ